MLNLCSRDFSDCQSTSRRGFLLQVGSLGGVGLTLDQALRRQRVYADRSQPPAKDVNCILIWTRGGTSHHDTVDPKPDARAEIRGEFGTVQTAIPGVRFSDQVPEFARRANLFSVVRNLNSINGAHGTADAIMLSAESAAGDWPEEAVSMMNSIAEAVERDPAHGERVHFTVTQPDPTTADALAEAAKQIAGTVSARAIICFTMSGSTAPMSQVTPTEHSERRNSAAVPFRTAQHEQDTFWNDR